MAKIKFSNLSNFFRFLGFLLFTFYFLLFQSCKQEKEILQVPSLNEYFPLETGRYITYQLDSLVWVNFGTRDTTISYQVKFQTDSLIEDNLGRPAYRIFRYIRKNSSQPWMPEGTFMAINTGSTVELLENNMRFIKLAAPVQNDFSWKGNTYVDTYSANSTLHYMDNWDYVYANIGAAEMIGTNNLDKVLTVNQRDEVVGLPDNPDSYSEINYSQEKYALGIGLVYKKFNHKEFQPNNGGYVADGSYGITLTMIDHN